ncbi:MAG TPA: FAD-binding oxidoreductase [Candidatus Saccharimonadales bacterium]|nr:FAD-binding oxidoreductase [Candidatus Saccharimonadales bacterium]
MTPALEHSPEDMTATADAGLTLAALQTDLAKGGQWLPIDPPFPESLSLADLLAHDRSGPRRFGYGTIRDYVIGLKVRLADGRVIKTGGKVVKNVAGYDLQKLFIGAKHDLGSIVEATFKLRPLPETEQFVQRRCSSLSEAAVMIDTILDSPLNPTVLDLHPCAVVLGFDGSRDEVEWQLAKAKEMGFVEQANLNYERRFWADDPGTIGKISVLPSRLIETIQQHGGSSYVARAGNGILYCHNAIPSSDESRPLHLLQRVKQIFSTVPP